jgi:vitamin B12 transporter
MKKFYLFFSLFCFSQLYVTAQSDSVKTTLSEVIITATRTETPAVEIGSSYSLMASEQIEKQQLNSVVDVLRQLPGLSIVQQGGPGKVSNVFMRGANSNHTLVIMDGVVMNDPSSPNNAFDFSFLNTLDVDRIEVVRGPQSTLYGSDAMAGIINIISKKGTSVPQYNFAGETGSNGYYRGNISALGTYGILNYAVTATRNGSDGVSSADARYGNTEKDSYSNNSFMSKLGISAAQNFSLELLYKYAKEKSAIDQSEIHGDDPNYTYSIEEQIFKGGANLSLFGGSWKQSFNASLIKNFSRSLDLPDEARSYTSLDAFYKAQRTKFDWQNTLSFLQNNLIMFGVESSKEQASTNTISGSEWGPYNSMFPESSMRNTAVYLQDQLSYSNSFFTSVGIRYDKNEKFGGTTTFRIAPAYFIEPTSTKIKMSYGTAFKAPSLYYLFDPLYGNPDLKPERSKGWDFGFEQYFLNNTLCVSATYFDLEFQDMFGYGPDYKEINIAKASSRGIEFTTSVKSVKNLSIDASYTYTKTKNEYDDGSGDFNKALLRRPEHQLSLNANYQISTRLNFNSLIQFVGKRDDKDFSDYINVKRVVLQDYTLVSFAVSYKLWDYLQLHGRIDNVLDKQYEEVLYYGTLGRAFYLGFSFTY